MFQFPRFAPFRVVRVRSHRVPPFGCLRISARLQLPGAFRRSLRPSSPLGAWASTVCPLLLDLLLLPDIIYLSWFVLATAVASE